MTPCTAQSSVGRAMQWQWWIQLMAPCTAQSSVGRAMSMAMVDTTYDSLHYPVKCW